MELGMLETFSNVIGLPKGLQTALISTIEENWHLGIFHDLVQNPNGTPRDGGYGGCNNDAFSVFGFLAFLLAAANLLMMDAAKRKKRSDDFQECVVGNDNKKEVLEASYSMLRGFLNALDAHDKNCSNYFVCEAAQEAAKLGAVGKTLAGVASANAQSWLLHANETLHSGTEDAGKHGSGELSCLEKYPCKDFHSNYKRPTLI